MKNIFGSIELIYTTEECKKYIKACKGNKYELFIKLILAYRLTRYELLFLEWKDIDFENNTITIYPTKYKINTRSYKVWDFEKVEELKRTFPLLKNIKKLLLIEHEKQVERIKHKEHYNKNFTNYVCVRKDGERMNANTISRNIRYIARDNNLPQVLQSGLKKSLDEYIRLKSNSYEFFRCWTRFDIEFKKQNIYTEIKLFNKRFISDLESIIEPTSQSKKSDIEM